MYLCALLNYCTVSHTSVLFVISSSQSNVQKNVVAKGDS